MPTLRDAAELLSAANTVDGRRRIAHFVGFTGEPLPLDNATMRQLGLPREIQSAELSSSLGALRLLSFDAPSATSIRAVFTQLAHTLHRNSAHALWIIVGCAASGDEVGISAWSPRARGLRVVALAAERKRIVASDSDTLLALAASADGDDLLVHARWFELLGREALSRRFYRVLEECVGELSSSLHSVPAEERGELALLQVSRLLFLSFLETKGWLNGDHAFLARQFDDCMSSGGRFHHRVLLPLFFGTLNTRISHRAPAARKLGAIPFLNGGLFTRTALERRHANSRFNDEAFGSLFGNLLGNFRFTARESDERFMEASIDPEMLGRAFESLMVAHARRSSGAFYTPQDLVAHVTSRALEIALTDDVLHVEHLRGALAGERLRARERDHLEAKLEHFSVLDPACGSGAFLVHVLERLADLQRACGDVRDVATVRREVLGRAIHGVDVNPTAVWLCELRLWLSVVIEGTETRMTAVPPLPNLDCNVRVGDSLAGRGFDDAPTLVGPSAALARLHARYVRASGPGKEPLRRSLVREERKRALAAIDREILTLATQRRERARSRRAADLFGLRSPPDSATRGIMRVARLRAAELRRERRRLVDGGALPFSFASHFANVHARGGFQLVIGNPPWVRVHNIPAADRITLRNRFSVFRNASWEGGARSGHASAGFASQVDLASLFVERSAGLVAQRGCVALLLPSKLWRSLAGGGVRALLSSRLSLQGLEDWSSAPALFDAAVYPSVMIASPTPRAEQCVSAAVRMKNTLVEWFSSPKDLLLDREDSASPLLLLPPPVRASFDLVRDHGIPLSASTLGRPLLGVKCGHNDAFIVQSQSLGLECRALRPLLRGESVSPWRIAPSNESIIWTHDANGAALRELPSACHTWLVRWKRALISRADYRPGSPWWTLYRTEAADFSTHRVVWSDFGRRPRAAVLVANDRTVPLNTCYVVRCSDYTDALTLCALINCALAAAWLGVLAEPARGGWHRYLGWTVSLLPLPVDWSHARSVLAPFAERGVSGEHVHDADLLDAACHAYGIRAADVGPLLDWCQITSAR